MKSKKNWNDFIASKKFKYTLFTIAVIAVGILLCTSDSISTTLYGEDNPEAKGKVLATYLSIIGGACVIYGLYLNNKKIGEQTRQNNIAEKTNIDKRFGDAVGYLNSDNDGIAIGGAYALFQIAKEDKRYKSIVANIFCDFISANFSSGNKIRLIGVVKELLFQNLDTVFLETELTLRNISFEKNDRFHGKVNIGFKDCSFEGVVFNMLEFTRFESCKINKSHLIDCNKIDIVRSEISGISIRNLSMPTKEVNLVDNIYLGQVEIYAQTIIGTLYIGSTATSFDDDFVDKRIVVYTDCENRIEINDRCKKIVSIKKGTFYRR
jgi:hypothetical protein